MGKHTVSSFSPVNKLLYWRDSQKSIHEVLIVAGAINQEIVLPDEVESKFFKDYAEEFKGENAIFRLDAVSTKSQVKSQLDKRVDEENKKIEAVGKDIDRNFNDAKNEKLKSSGLKGKQLEVDVVPLSEDEAEREIQRAKK